MNKSHRIVWNESNQCWQVVAEIAKSAGKGHSSVEAVDPSSASATDQPGFRGFAAKPLFATIAFLLGTFTASPGVWANQQGGAISAGSGSIAQTASTTTVQQTSQGLAINWASFNVGANQSVVFAQPNTSAVVLNRVTGAQSSTILGSISANGQVFILNPNGVLFGQGSQVNVGGLVASTLALTDADFMAGNYRFTSVGGNGSVVNLGNITAARGGSVALISPLITNSGSILAPQGSVLLAAADRVTLTLQNGSLTSYTLDQGTLASLITNGGLIQANGGQVIVTAKGLDASACWAT